MEIEKDKTYVCIKNLHSKVGSGHIAFLEGKEYTAWKNNILTGEDNICYTLPPHSKLSSFFKLKAFMTEEQLERAKQIKERIKKLNDVLELFDMRDARNHYNCFGICREKTIYEPDGMFERESKTIYDILLKHKKQILNEVRQEIEQLEKEFENL